MWINEAVLASKLAHRLSLCAGFCCIALCRTKALQTRWLNLHTDTGNCISLGVCFVVYIAILICAALSVVSTPRSWQAEYSLCAFAVNIIAECSYILDTSMALRYKFQLLPKMKGFIGEFAKLKKSHYELRHVRLSVRRELGSPGRILMALDIRGLFECMSRNSD